MVHGLNGRKQIKELSMEQDRIFDIAFSVMAGDPKAG
jgi:hypothetical protein